jgi:hypothetical protein
MHCLRSRWPQLRRGGNEALSITQHGQSLYEDLFGTGWETKPYLEVPRVRPLRSVRRSDSPPAPC